jgi:hypothetical protein
LPVLHRLRSGGAKNSLKQLTLQADQLKMSMSISQRVETDSYADFAVKFKGQSYSSIKQNLSKYKKHGNRQYCDNTSHREQQMNFY